MKIARRAIKEFMIIGAVAALAFTLMLVWAKHAEPMPVSHDVYSMSREHLMGFPKDGKEPK